MNIRVGGVPEHFNYPWHRALEEQRFQQLGIDLQWSDYPGGTGALVQDLNDNKLDLAVLLTEGAVAAIAKGCPASLLHFTVRSPLYWGIHTGTSSTLQSLDDIPGKTFAISRFGSGSHLMAIVQALMNGWPLDHMQWLEVKNLEGAKQALVEQQADVFLWERFMTKPLVDAGWFRLLGLLPTPWSSFVLAVRNDFWRDHQEMVSGISEALLSVQRTLKKDQALPGILAARYGLQTEDVKTWLAQTEWETGKDIQETVLEDVVLYLVQAGVLQKSMPAKTLLAEKA